MVLLICCGSTAPNPVEDTRARRGGRSRALLSFFEFMSYYSIKLLPAGPVASPPPGPPHCGSIYPLNDEIYIFPSPLPLYPTLPYWEEQVGGGAARRLNLSKKAKKFFL